MQQPARILIYLTSDNLFVLGFLYILQDSKSKILAVESTEKDTGRQRNKSWKPEKMKLPAPESAEAAGRSRIYLKISRPPKNPKINLEHPKDLRNTCKKGEAQIQSGG